MALIYLVNKIQVSGRVVWWLSLFFEYDVEHKPSCSHFKTDVVLVKLSNTIKPLECIISLSIFTDKTNAFGCIVAQKQYSVQRSKCLNLLLFRKGFCIDVYKINIIIGVCNQKKHPLLYESYILEWLKDILCSCYSLKIFRYRLFVAQISCKMFPSMLFLLFGANCLNEQKIQKEKNINGEGAPLWLSKVYV